MVCEPLGAESGIAHAAPAYRSHLTLANQRRRCTLSRRSSSRSWSVMHSWVTASSRPKVWTKYPLDQKCHPAKLCLRSPQALLLARHTFCSGSLRNAARRRGLLTSLQKGRLLPQVGANTTCFLRSHVRWLWRVGSSAVTLPIACSAAHKGRGSSMDTLERQPSAITPAVPGGISGVG